MAAMEKPKGKWAPMGMNVSRIVEITDEDETLVIAFVPVDAPATSSSSTTGSTMETPS
jgi:hypothetical protein